MRDAERITELERRVRELEDRLAKLEPGKHYAIIDWGKWGGATSIEPIANAPIEDPNDRSPESRPVYRGHAVKVSTYRVCDGVSKLVFSEDDQPGHEPGDNN